MLRESIPDFPYTESTLWLDLNIAMQSLVIAARLLVINLLWKTKLMKFEDKLLSERLSWAVCSWRSEMPRNCFNRQNEI